MCCLVHEQIGEQVPSNLGITDGANVKTIIEALMQKKLNYFKLTTVPVELILIYGCDYNDS